jgi:ATP:ADP antiporter, AAA family
VFSALLPRSLLHRKDLPRLLALMGTFFLVVCAVGILRPIKNSLALDGLGASNFYKVYLVSALVVLFVPPYNRLAERIQPRVLIPVVALFFGANLVLFRLLYTEGSAAYGMLFYGWYDLFAAALVTQFFLATQLVFSARDAKAAYPLVIAGGSIGATAGGLITGFFAEAVGTPNLLLVAAGIIAVFAVTLPLVWPQAAEREAPRRPREDGAERLSPRHLRRIFANRQVRLIAAMVLLTILVKQLVDFQFNAITKEVFETRDAVAAFQGKFNAATQWLPLLVLAALGPLLRRWGVAVAVLLLPVAMFLGSAALVVAWSLWAAVAVKGSDAALRYSAERTGREILYVPVPEEIKLQAKTYIDVALEKGAGKALSAVGIFLLLLVMDYRSLPYVAVVLAGLWVAVALLVRREYVHSLSAAIRGRFASVGSTFAPVVDRSTLPVLERGLDSASQLELSFVLDLLGQVGRGEAAPLRERLARLAHHPSAGIRARALHALAGVGDGGDEAIFRAAVGDAEPQVREAAVRGLCALHPGEASALLRAPAREARLALLGCMARGEVDRPAGGAGESYVRELLHDAGDDPAARLELALSVAALGPEALPRERAAGLLEGLLADTDAEVACAALRGAGALRLGELVPRMIAALGAHETRVAAREALAALGVPVLPAIERALLDGETPPRIRRALPSVLARIPAQATVDTTLRALTATETDQLLDDRLLKALGKLRRLDPSLAFDEAGIVAIMTREVEAAGRYAGAAAALTARAEEEEGGPSKLLRRALSDACTDRREAVFRCLGLLHDPEKVYRCFLAVQRGNRMARDTALEWLEQTLGHARFLRLAPVLEPLPAAPPAAPLNISLWRLEADNDSWLAHCAGRLRFEPRPPAPPPTPPPDGSMDLIEKVLLLQRVDLLQEARSAHLALLGSIAETVEVASGQVLLPRDEPPQCLYVVIRGRVEVNGGPGAAVQAGPGTAFGTWALIDDSPSLVEARAAEPSQLLRISRRDFHELLSEHSELAVGLLQGLARRFRAVAV